MAGIVIPPRYEIYILMGAVLYSRVGGLRWGFKPPGWLVTWGLAALWTAEILRRDWLFPLLNKSHTCEFPFT